MKNIIYSLCLFGAILYSCTSQTVVTSTSTSNTTINTSSDYVANGKSVFDSKCGRCHGLPEPKEFNKDEWVKIIASMAPKAKLNADETNWVLSYVTVNAKQ